MPMRYVSAGIFGHSTHVGAFAVPPLPSPFKAVSCPLHIADRLVVPPQPEPAPHLPSPRRVLKVLERLPRIPW